MTDPLERLTAALAERYLVQRRLGAGGMAVVYLAEDLKHHRSVALKVLRPELAAAIGPERFQREIEVTARLHHPNILPVLDSGEAAGLLFYAMPYVEGESLRDRLDREKQIGLEQSLRIATEVADGLSYAHGHGVLHRDIKPENILLQAGHALIADFGIARAIGAAGGQQLTSTGFAVGTPHYMSPEQSAAAKDIDGRSDVYSLGCVLYEMLAGQPPFVGPTADSIVRQHLVTAAPSVATMRPIVSRGMARVIDRALAKTPADRYSTPAEFAEALRHASTAGEEEREPRSRARGVRWAVGIGLLLAAVALGARWIAGGRGAAGPINRLVVLPLQNLSPRPDQEYFSDGMTDALITSLASIPGLAVISRTSAMHYKGTTKTLPDIARELRVQAVVEGSVVQEGGIVRINISLVEAATDRRILNRAYDRPATNVLQLQNEVTRAIAQEVKVALSPETEQRLAEAPSVDTVTHRLYLLGRYHWNQRTPEGLTLGLRYFEQAIARDPRFAPAQAGKADAYGLLGCCGYDVFPPRQSMPKSREAALEALRLDDRLADAHTSLAWVKFNFDWDWAGAEAELRRALVLNPGYSTAHMWLSGLLGVLGRADEALEEARRALDIDPLALIVNANLGLQLYNARRFTEAIEQLRVTLEISPTFPIALLWKAKAHLAVGQKDSALALTRRFAAVSGRQWMSVAFLGYVEGVSGARDSARAAVGELAHARDSGYVSAYHLAVASLGAGRTADAIRWLEAAFEERSDFLIYLAIDSIFDLVRSDPRFVDLVRRVGLPTPAGHTG